MSKFIESLETLRDLYQAAEVYSVDARIKQNNYRKKILNALECYVGPFEELPENVHNLLFKKDKSFKGRYSFKTDIWHIVCFFRVNQVPQDLAELWCIEFEKVSADLEDKWDDAWTNIIKPESVGYFSYDTLDFTSKYCSDLSVVEAWKEGNWKNPTGRNRLIGLPGGKREAEGEEKRVSKFKKRE